MTFPSQRTQPSIRQSWVGRHFAGLGAAVGGIAGILATLIATLKIDVDPLKAVTAYGMPTAISVCMAFALGWLVGIYLPRREEQHLEILRQANSAASEQMAHMREVVDATREAADRERQLDRDMYRETITVILDRHSALRDDVREVQTQVERIHDRLDGLTSGQYPRIPKRKES